MNGTRDFWQSSGHHLLDRDGDGMLVVTDEFLKAYLARPEIAPPVEACPAERALHATLMQSPREAVSPAQIAAVVDVDARENWLILIQLRDQLLHHRTIEAAYLDIVRNGRRFPHLFLNQLVHLILRNVLDDCSDPFILRAAELFFRPQKLAVHEGSLIAADEETLSGFNTRPISPLVSMLGLPEAANIEVLSERNSGSYWSRSDRFDMALDLTVARRGLSALGDTITYWVSHLFAIDVTVEPLAELRDVTLSWYVGLDAEGTRIGDSLWNGEELDEPSRLRLVGLYLLTFDESSTVLERMHGEPVYLIAAMSRDKTLMLKPQNLVTGLPLRARETMS